MIVVICNNNINTVLPVRFFKKINNVNADTNTV